MAPILDIFEKCIFLKEKFMINIALDSGLLPDSTKLLPGAWWLFYI